MDRVEPRALQDRFGSRGTGGSRLLLHAYFQPLDPLPDVVGWRRDGEQTGHLAMQHVFEMVREARAFGDCQEPAQQPGTEEHADTQCQIDGDQVSERNATTPCRAITVRGRSTL